MTTPYDRFMALAKTGALKEDVRLKPHHQEGIKRMVGAGGSHLFAHGTGTGKTLLGVASVEKLRELGKAHTALVITPAALRDNFIEAGVKKFTDQAAVRLGSRGEKGSYHIRGKNLPKAPYYVTSMEMFRKDPHRYIDRTGADTVVVDELHKAREQSTANHQALMAIRPRIRNAIGLTGTPVMNHPRDIVPTLDFIANRKHGIPGGQAFDKTFVTHQMKHHGPLGWLGIGPKSSEATLNHKDYLKRQVGKWVHYVPGEDVGDMPKKLVHDIEVPMSHHQQRLHQAAIDRSSLSTSDKWRIRNNLPVNQHMAMHFLAQLQQARQASNSIHPFDSRYSPERSADDTPKVKRLLDDVETHLKANPKHQALISTHFVHGGVDVLSAGLAKRNIPHGMFIGSTYQKRHERDAHVKDYLAGKHRVMILNQAAAEGLNLNNTTAHFTLDPHYNPASVEQIESRGARLDNKLKEIPVYRYRSTLPTPKVPLLGLPLRPRHTGTDEWIYSMMGRKSKLNNELLGLIHDKPKQKAASDCPYTRFKTLIQSA